MQHKNPKISISFDKDTVYLLDDLLEKTTQDSLTISKFIRKLLKEHFYNGQQQHI
jgi:hypothetical protein